MEHVVRHKSDSDIFCQLPLLEQFLSGPATVSISTKNDLSRDIYFLCFVLGAVIIEAFFTSRVNQDFFPHLDTTQSNCFLRKSFGRTSPSRVTAADFYVG